MDTITSPTTFIRLTAADGMLLTDGRSRLRSVVCTSQEEAARWSEIPIPVRQRLPGPDTAEKDAAERSIVRAVHSLFQSYGAADRLLELDDYSLQRIRMLATRSGVREKDYKAMMDTVKSLAAPLAKLYGKPWPMCWNDIRLRFPRWLSATTSNSPDTGA